MSNAPHETAPTEFVQVGGVRFAYRRFGRPRDLPLLLLNYFAATLDDWDPLVTNGLACEREVMLFDNAGVGSSTGDTPPTVAAMTKDCVDFCRALDLMSFDVMGFSLGGMIAQQLAQDHPDMILLGAGPRGGEGMTFTELSVDELGDPVALLMGAFFTPSEASQAAGRAYIERLKLRTADRDAPISKKAAGAQLEAIPASGAPFPRRTATRCWTGSASPRWSCMGTRTSSSRRSTPSSWRSTCLTPSS
jgi:pimeloyl-ACP methyl ester carboxylesterase